jgi:hypothetical protein
VIHVRDDLVHEVLPAALPFGKAGGDLKRDPRHRADSVAPVRLPLSASIGGNSGNLSSGTSIASARAIRSSSARISRL